MSLASVRSSTMIRCNGAVRGQKGAGMIEMLVAMSLMAVGLLGVLSMQTTGLRSNQRSVFITEAHLLAEDMVNMIMAYDDLAAATPAFDAYDGMKTEIGQTRKDCTGGCDRASQVEHDKSDWSAQIEERLPGGFGQVLGRQVDGNDILVVTVMWDLDLKGISGGAAPLDAEGRIICPTDIACYSIEVNI